MIQIPQSTSRVVMLKLFLSSDHVTAATGKTLAITISKNGGAFGNPNAGATNATEVASGWYKVTLDTTDTGTVGDLVVRGTSASCDDVERIFGVVKATNGGMTALPDAAAEAAGGLFTRGTGAGQINQPSNGRIDVYIDESSHAATMHEKPITTGTAQAGSTSSTIKLAAGASSTDNFLNYCWIKITGGTGSGQTRHVHAYNGTSKVASISPNWITTPDNTSTYSIIPVGAHPLYDGSITSATFASGAISSSTLAAGAINNAALASDFPIKPIATGTAQAGGASTITLNAGASAAQNFYVNCWIVITGGTGVGQSRLITVYNGTTKIATVSWAWVIQPDATSVFSILPANSVNVGSSLNTEGGNIAANISQVTGSAANASRLSNLCQFALSEALTLEEASTFTEIVLSVASGPATVAGSLVGSMLKAVTAFGVFEQAVRVIDHQYDSGTEAAVLTVNPSLKQTLDAGDTVYLLSDISPWQDQPADFAAAGSFGAGVKLVDDAITAAKIAANAIGSAELADGAITAAKIASDAITSAKVADGFITAAKIASAAITDAKIAFPAETAGRATTFLAAMRRAWEWVVNKRTRNRDTGVVTLLGADNTTVLETQTQSTSGSTDTQTKGV